MDIPRINPGDGISASFLNMIVDAVSSRIMGAQGIVVQRLGRDVVIRLGEVSAGGASAVVFPVTVEKTGGSDGTATTTASWTYTVKNLLGQTIGTGVAVTRPRPNGKMTYQAGSAGFGLAFYSGTTLKLWDAGEVPTTGACTT